MSQNIIIHKDIQGITYYRRRATMKDTIHAYFRVNGKTYRFSTRKTSLPDASKVAHKKHHLAEKGREVKTITFKKVLSKYLEQRRTRVTAKTYKDYKLVSRYLLEYFGEKDITTITDRSIINFEKWRREYYKDRPKLKHRTYTNKYGKKVVGRKNKEIAGNRTINLNITILLGVLRFAHEVCDYIRADQVPKWKKLKENRREVFITKKEVGKLYKYFTKNNKELHASIIIFCFYTGVRYPSELNNIKWKDVNLDGNCVLIRNRKSKSTVVNTQLPLLKEAKSILKLMPNKADAKGEDFVFVDQKMNKPYKSISKSFKNAVSECGLDERLTMYSLRHSFITYILTHRSDISMKFLSMAVGHRDTQMVEKVYGHLDNDAVISAFKDGETGSSAMFDSVDLNEFMK